LRNNADPRRCTLYAVFSQMVAPVQGGVCSLLLTLSTNDSQALEGRKLNDTLYKYLRSCCEKGHSPGRNRNLPTPSHVPKSFGWLLRKSNNHGPSSGWAFVPRRFRRNGDLQTIVGTLLPHTDSLLEPESQLIEMEAATSARGAS
jgi:hypothetical protein